MPSGRVTEVFQLQPKNLTWEQFFWWLWEVHRHYRRKLIVVWDNLSSHLKAAAAMRKLELPWIEFVQLPSYAPELNPVEGLWSDTKHHAMGNWAAPDVAALGRRAEQELQSRKRRSRRLRSYFTGAGLTTARN
jgi:transposase